MNLGGPAQLVRNEGGNRNHWLSLRTIGTRSNRDGVGARVTVVTGTRRQMREVKCGSSYLCGSDLRVLIGLGNSQKVDRLEIRWPSGQEDVIEEVPVDRFLVVKEGEGIITDTSP